MGENSGAAKDSSRRPERAKSTDAHGRHRYLLAAVAVLVLAVIPAVAFADSPTSPTAIPADLLQEAIGAGSSAETQPTNPQAAQELPHENLSRDEAVELTESVFAPVLQSAVGPIQNLEVDKYLSDNAAIVNAAEPPESLAENNGSDSQSQETVLLESTIPLRTEVAGGNKEAVDLELEASGDHLEPKAPLVEVELPRELGDGIALPESGIGIELLGASSERAPSTMGETAVLYPNIAADTDFSAAPTPTGVETLTTLRGADSPHSQTYRLSLPSGATLRQDDEGAEVIKGGKEILAVPVPSAIDATGADVPVSMNVSGDSLTVTAAPSEDATLPILVDPLFESYEWFPSKGTTGQSTWHFSSNASRITSEAGSSGLVTRASAGSYAPGNSGGWGYYVPRLKEDEEHGYIPSSFITHMTVSHVMFLGSTGTYSPYLTAGILGAGHWAGVPGHEAVWGYGGNMANLNYPGSELNLENGTPGERDKTAKTALGMAFNSTENTTLGSERWVTVGGTTIEVTDIDNPTVGVPSFLSSWVNQTATEPIPAEAGDPGLGVKNVRFEVPGQGTVTVPNGCAGTVASPCPRNWSTSLATSQYSPALMPQGIDRVSIAAEDPVANKTPEAAVAVEQVKVDHTKPTLAPLSGTVTEQGTLGSWKPSYTVKYNATDGDEAAAEALPSIGGEGTAPGKTERPDGVAVEANGNVLVLDRANKRVTRFDKNGAFLNQFGTPGTADGQLNDPMSIAVSAAGNIWITEMANARVQEFNSSGQFIRKITCACFSQPYAVAAGPNQAIWITDIGTDKLFKYNEQGTQLLVAHGNQANPNGTATDMTNVTGIAVDANGGVWAAEFIMNKILHFDANGNYVSQFGTQGTGDGQLTNPAFVAVAPSGSLMVVDYSNNRLQEFKPDGTFMRKFGSLGSGVGQMNSPQEPAFGTDGVLYVPDYNNHRVNRWAHADLNPQSGVASTEVKVDGVQVEKYAPGCPTRNCTISHETTLDTNKFAAGLHTLEVIATDGVGLSSTSGPLKFESHPDKTAPAVALSGTMTEQGTLGTTRPNYTVKVSATDPGGAEERKSGVVGVTTKFGGTVVKTSSQSCPAEGCSLAQEWTLEASKYPAGAYTLETTATDAAGLTTTKTQTVNIAKDTTPPTLSTTNYFYNAPEGWLEQISYNYNASASDSGGYGLASLVLKIDGTVVKSVSQTCPAGSCSESLGAGIKINMATYSGGEHPAELIATDGAGNVAKKEWTINVDPNGAISANEAEDTLEAFEATEPEGSPIASTSELIDPKERAEGNDPGLEESGGNFIATGTPTPVVVSAEPSEGVSIQSLEGTIEVSPTEAASGSSIQIAAEVSAVSPNTGSAVDTVIRPKYNGILAFQAIRNESAAQAFSWEVSLPEGGTLKALEGGMSAAVYYEDGERAMLISTEGAVDAVGHAVPTVLTVSEGNVVTLTISHRGGGYVYPVVGGPAFEVGYSSVEVITPPEGGAEVVESITSPPAEDPAIPDPEAGTSKKKRMTHHQDSEMTKCQTEACWLGFWEMHFSERFFYNGKEKVPGGQAWHDEGEHTWHICNKYSSTEPWSLEPNACVWIGNHAPYGYGHYMCAQNVWHANDHLSSEYHAMTFHNYGDGYVGKKQNSSCDP